MSGHGALRLWIACMRRSCRLSHSGLRSAGVLTWFEGDVYLGQFQKGEFYGFGPPLVAAAVGSCCWLLFMAHAGAAATAFTSTVILVIIPAIFTRAGTSPPSPPPPPLLQLHPSSQLPMHRYHKGVRHGSGVYKFKGLPPGGIKKQTHADDADDDYGAAEAAAATEHVVEGGVYIGEWNSGCMQGLGILKYDDGER